MVEQVNFHRATRRALFGARAEPQVPGAGRSAAEAPERHLRTKVTMNIDRDLLAYFKEEAKARGRSYQLLINQALREYIEGDRPERLAVKVGSILLEDESFIQQVVAKVKEASE